MDKRYKIILSNRNLYKEAELLPETTQVKVGTDVSCDVRLHKDMFYEPIELDFIKKDGSWTLLCAENLYLTVSGDLRKLQTRQMEHGSMVSIHYQNNGNQVFSIEFVIDFDDGNHKFDCYADISGTSSVSVGSSRNCNIMLYGEYTGNDYMELARYGSSYQMRIRQTTYGVLHNGKKASDGEVLEDGDFFSISGFYFYVKNNKIWTENKKGITFQGMQLYTTVSRGLYPKFRRNSRVKIAVNEEKIPFLDPAQKPTKPKNNLLLRLLPSVGMVLAAALMACMGGSTMIIFSLVSVTCAGITAVLTFRESNKEYDQNVAERIETYNNYVANKCAEIEKFRVEERNTLEEIYTSQQKEIQEVHSFSSDLFDRAKEDEDFLCVRFGTGSIESHRPIDYKKQEKLEPGDELQQIPEQIEAKYKYLDQAPIVCDLKEQNAVGIIGSESYRYEIMKNMAIDLAARQYMTDVRMMFVAEEKNKDKVRWLRMLPHVWNDNLQIRNIVMNDESKTILFEYLYKVLTAREQAKGFPYHIVVFFYNEYGFQNHPVSRFVERAKDLGVHFIFFGETRADIPLGCGALVDLQDQQTGYLVDTADRSNNHGFYYPSLTQQQAERIVELLAPVYTDEVSLEGSLTKNISLFQLLNILAVDDLDLTQRWAGSNVTKSMAAPIGVTKTGEISLDLHDKAHGPHGLVAGTTGSGKSEILQTYILSMVTLFHPYEVGFVIIDFKGGGMVNQFANLPHLVGAITNIDGREIDRSLKSIKAELQKRQRLFAEADVNHIDKYIKKYKAGEVSVPLPHLIIIVDEFAELKADQPEFMKELISAARIGRSLGVHLILATQKPAGQVNEQIWSNSRFKLCLKVQSQEDSNEVLKSPLASEIKEPGRAYLQVGNNELFELLQSAYSGMPEKADDSKLKEFSVYELTDSARRVPVYSQKKQKSEDNLTQLDAIVKYVNEYCTRNHIEKLPDICLPSLKECISFPETEKLIAKDYNVSTEIGIYDDPDNQYQGTYAVDFANQNVMIIGSSQSGKTNILQTMIRSIASKYSPDEVTIYIIDFASMILKNFSGLNHVGGVVTSNEDEKLKNLMKLLFHEMEVRKEKMLKVGVSSFAAYKEAGKTDLPQIIVMIDNLTALRELYFQDDDQLLKLCREGLSVGISIVIANSMTTGIGYRYLSNFSCRIALFCNDSSEYGALFDHCRQTVRDVHGRCIIELDKTLLECQTFLAFEGEKEIDRVKSIRTFIQEQNRIFAKHSANMIPVIPEKMTAEFIMRHCTAQMTKPSCLVAGLDYATVSPFVLDFSNLGVLALVGRPGMGQNNFLHYAVMTQEAVHPDGNQVYIVDGIAKRMRDMAEWKQVARYEYLPDRAPEIVKNIEAELKLRYQALTVGEDSALDKAKQITLIIGNQDALQAIALDKAALEAYRNITGKYKSMKVCILIANFENAAVSFSAPEPIKKVKDNRHFLYFDDLANMKIIDLPLALTRTFKKPIEVGDCYYIRENECVKLKTPRA